MIDLAPQDRIKELKFWIDKVLLATGHPGALVTDESYLSDFRPLGMNKEEYCKYIGNELQIELKLDKLSLCDIAEQLRDTAK